MWYSEIRNICTLLDDVRWGLQKSDDESVLRRFRIRQLSAKLSTRTLNISDP